MFYEALMQLCRSDYFTSLDQHFSRFSYGGRWRYWNETTFAALVAVSQRDEDVCHLLETALLVTSESANQLERSCRELGAHRLAADRALYRRLHEKDPNLTQVASLLLSFYVKDINNYFADAAEQLLSDIKRELRADSDSFDPGALLAAQFSCLAIIFDLFDPIAHRVKCTIRKEFDELLEPSDRSWFMDLGGELS